MINDDSRAPSTYNARFFEAWETFADEIQLVFEFAGPEAQIRPIATKQSQYVLANMALAKLLRNIGQSETAAHFHKMAEALQDVVEGIHHPLFQVEKIDKNAAGKRGRQPDTSETWNVRASLCIGIQFLIASGLDQDYAVALVVQKHRMQLTKLQRPGTGLKSSLSTWLKSFATDAVRNEVALGAYKQGMNDLAELRSRVPSARLLGAGNRLVANAAERAANLIKI